jgi:hypothetical protein
MSEPTKEQKFRFRMRMEAEDEAERGQLPPVSPNAPTKPEASTADMVLGSAPARVAMGAASPLVGAAQLGANIGSKMSPYLPGYEEGQLDVGQWVNQKLGEIEASKQRGMAARGNEGYDWPGLLGSMGTGGAIGKEMGALLPKAQGLFGRMGVGAAQGAVAGGTQPVTSDQGDYFQQKGVQAGIGSLVVGAVPALSAGVQGVYGLGKQAVEPIYQSGRKAILQRFQRGLLANDPARIQQAVQAAEQAKTIVPGSRPTLGEALADLPPEQAAGMTGLQAHQQNIAKLPGVSPEFAERAAQQEAARASVLVPMARNEGALAGDIAVRNTVTGPMREAATSAVNQRGQTYRTVADKVANLQNLKDNQQRIVEALSQPSISRTLKSQDPSEALKTSIELHAPYAEPTLPTAVQKAAGEHAQSSFINAMEQKAKALGIAKSNAASLDTMQRILSSIPQPPLKAASIIQQLNRKLAKPEVEGSPYTQKALLSIKDHVSNMADEHGIIDARSLYQFKKEGVNQLIDATMDKTNPKFAERFRNTELIGIKKSIDDAIEGAGGEGWKKYLATYEELSQGINRLEQGQGLQKALQTPLETGERGQAFGKAVKEADLSALTDQDKQSIQKLAEELARLDAFKRSARETSLSGADAIPGKVGLPLPNLLSRPAMIANYIMGKFGQSAEDKIAQLAKQQYLNPAQFAAGQQVPVRYRPMIEALMQQMPAAAGTAAGRQF